MANETVNPFTKEEQNILGLVGMIYKQYKELDNTTANDLNDVQNALKQIHLKLGERLNRRAYPNLFKTK